MSAFATPMRESRKTRVPSLLVGAIFAALAAAPLVLGSYESAMLAKMMIYAVFAISLNILVGYTGIASLGHAAYFGAGGYVVALLAQSEYGSFFVLLVAAVAVSAILAGIFAMLVLRASGPYQLMITLALSQVLWGLAYSLRNVTGGDDGIPGIRLPAVLPGLNPSHVFYGVIFVVFVAVVAGSWAFARSPFGRSLVGIRENSLRMRVLGYNIWLHKWIASMIAGALAGLAGALLTWHNGFVGPGYLSVQMSALVLIMVIVGGAGTVIGPIIGAFLLVGLETTVSTLTDRWVLILGIIYIFTALFAPRGVVGLFTRELRSNS
jgi:branched-chain amino acid transport system permease protein